MNDLNENEGQVDEGIVEHPVVRPCCANCRWGMELEHRYDQVHCINEESHEAFGDVEATSSCPLFQARPVHSATSTNEIEK